MWTESSASASDTDVIFFKGRIRIPILCNRSDPASPIRGKNVILYVHEVFLFSDYAMKIGQGFFASLYQWVLFQYPESGSMPLNWMRIRNKDILSGPLYGIHFYCGEGLPGFPGPLSSRFISSRAHACTGVQPYNQSNRNPAFLFLGIFFFLPFFLLFAAKKQYFRVSHCQIFS